MNPSTATRPAVPEDADELLRLRVAVLDGGPLTDEWRTTFRDDMRERLGTDPNLLCYVVPTPDGLAACAIGIVYHGYLGPVFPPACGAASTPWPPTPPTSGANTAVLSPPPSSKPSRTAAADPSNYGPPPPEHACTAPSASSPSTAS